MASLRWAVMGAGGIARRRTIPEGILPAENAELAVVYSPNSGSDVARQFGCAMAATESELFKHDFDAVYIASPVDCHLRQVEMAAAAGRHVLCEKPLALCSRDSERMVAACRDAGVTFGVGFMMRHHPYHRLASEIVRDGALGKSVYARAQLSCWYPPQANAWRQDAARGGGGALPDLASHCIDLLEMIVGTRVESVYCRAKRIVHDYPVDDTAVLLLEFAGGSVATIDCLFNAPDDSVQNRLELYGSSGSLLAEGTLGQTQSGTMRRLGVVGIAADNAARHRGDLHELSDFPLSAGNLYRSQIEDFGHAVQESRCPISTGEQGAWIQHILEASYRSSESGRSISLC